MLDTNEYNVIKHEDLTEDPDDNKTIDSTQRAQQKQICTDDILDFKLPVLNSIVNKTDLNSESHLDMYRETPNQNEIVQSYTGRTKTY